MNWTNDIQEWYYAGKADITWGEEHVSKAPKIILISLSVLIVILGVVGYIYRDYIYDFITDPKLELIKEVTYADGYLTQVEVNQPNFDPKQYINTNLDEINFEYEIENNVNISKIGNYNIVYRSINKVRTSEINLVVQVVDTTPPVIKIKTEGFDGNLYYDDVYDITTLKLTYESTDKIASATKLQNEFNPLDFIESITDNCTPNEKIKLDYTRSYDFLIPDNRSNISFKIIYQAEDEHQNIGTASLVVNVYEDLAAKEADELDKQAQIDKLEQELYDLLHPSVTPTPTPTPSPTPTPTQVQTATPTPKITATATPTPSPSGDIDTPNPTPTGEIIDNTPTPTVITYMPVVTVDPDEPENTGTPTPTPILEIGDAGIWAGDVTVSLADIGNDPTGMFLYTECTKQIHYVNTEMVGAMPVNMPGMDVQLKAGKYIVTWTTLDGKLTCEQRVTITE